MDSLCCCPCCTVTLCPCATAPSLSPANSAPMLVQAAHARVFLLDHVSARRRTLLSAQCKRPQSKRMPAKRRVRSPSGTDVLRNVISLRPFVNASFWCPALQRTSASPYHVVHARPVFAFHGVRKRICARAESRKHITVRFGPEAHTASAISGSSKRIGAVSKTECLF